MATIRASVYLNHNRDGYFNLTETDTRHEDEIYTDEQLYITIRQADNNQCQSFLTDSQTGWIEATTINGVEIDDTKAYYVYETNRNLNGEYTDDYFKNLTIEQPIKGYLSTTPRRLKASFDSSVASITFGHAKFKKIPPTTNGYLLYNFDWIIYAEEDKEGEEVKIRYETEAFDMHKEQLEDIDFYTKLYEVNLLNGEIMERGKYTDKSTFTENIAVGTHEVNTLNGIKLGGLAYNSTDNLLYVGEQELLQYHKYSCNKQAAVLKRRPLYRIEYDENNQYKLIPLNCFVKNDNLWKSFEDIHTPMNKDKDFRENDVLSREYAVAVFMGTIDSFGNYYIGAKYYKLDNLNDLSNVTQSDRTYRYYKINLNPNSLFFGQVIEISYDSDERGEQGKSKDWVWNKSDGRLYSFLGYEDKDCLQEVSNTNLKNENGNVTAVRVNRLDTYRRYILNVNNRQTDDNNGGCNVCNQSLEMTSLFRFDNAMMYLISRFRKIYTVDLSDNRVLEKIPNPVLPNNVQVQNPAPPEPYPTPIPDGGFAPCDYFLDGANFGEQSLLVDYGNAPTTGEGYSCANYKTHILDDGPRHFINNNIHLGKIVEDDSRLGFADSVTDNDCILYGTPDLPIDSNYYYVYISAYNNTGKKANIYAWVDFDTNGAFQGNESCVKEIPSSSDYKTIRLDFIKPASYQATLPYTFMRIRITTDDLINTSANIWEEDKRSIGYASDGEVEDYLINIKENIPLLYTIKAAFNETTGERLDDNILITPITVEGDIITYVILMVNYSQTSITKFTIKDQISDGCSFVEGTYGFLTPSPTIDQITDDYLKSEIPQGENITLDELKNGKTFESQINAERCFKLQYKVRVL